ncbi:hypothetical protein J6590_079839 [Homalodisca vitripennis]|nr:hypothetical protein J6590_079839 [Homalodisca vitripennis]
MEEKGLINNRTHRGILSFMPGFVQSGLQTCSEARSDRDRQRNEFHQWEKKTTRELVGPEIEKSGLFCRHFRSVAQCLVLSVPLLLYQYHRPCTASTLLLILLDKILAKVSGP